MKFAFTIDVPKDLAQRIHDYQISEAHKVHELIDLEPDQRLYYIGTLVMSAVHHAMSKSSVTTVFNTEKYCVQRIFSLTKDTARQFSISAESEMHRTFPKELHLLATNSVSHQDILRTIAELTYAGIGAEELSLSKIGF